MYPLDSNPILRRLFAIAVVVASSACSSVQMIGGKTYPSVPKSECSVDVDQTEAQAKKLGKLIELCVIEGTSSGSFAHTAATAIRKHKDKACRCGATKVYVQSRQPMGMSVASVSMVCFPS